MRPLKRIKIPKAPKAEKKSYKRKVRRSWKINPETQIVESEKSYNRKKEQKKWLKDFEEYTEEP